MQRLGITLACLCLVLSLTLPVDAANSLHSVSQLPKGLSPHIASLVSASGHQVTGDDGAVCSVWFLKQIPLKPGFKTSLGIQYPFTPGQLIGALQVSEGSSFTDFRGQELKPGVYTLRYGHQPQDGNHFGQILDYLLALPAAADTDPKPIASYKDLVEVSARSAGASHPAIFSLQTVEKPAKEPALVHDKDHDFWILSATASGKNGEKDTSVPIRLVVVGKTAE